MNVKYVGSRAREIMYPNARRVMNIVARRRTDFHLFVDIWSWNEILDVMVNGGGCGF